MIDFNKNGDLDSFDTFMEMELMDEDENDEDDGFFDDFADEDADED